MKDDTKTQEIKSKKLEVAFPNPYSVPTVYDPAEIIQWYLDGFDEIEVYPDRKRTFLYFAAVNGLLTISSDGDPYVCGMKVV